MKPTLIIANGSVTFKLYGDVDQTRLELETRTLAHRVSQLK